MRNKNKRYQCLLLLGEYYRQRGNEPESKKIFLQMVSSSQQEGNKKVTANAWQHLGQLHKEIDSIDLRHLNNSLSLYHEIQLKEKKIELLLELAGHHLKSDLNLMQNEL